MVHTLYVAWQNKAISRESDFRGVLILGLLVVWFYFIGQFLSLPPFATVVAGLPPLLHSALAKATYMPDFGMIILGFAAFHFRRELCVEWDGRIARRVYLLAVVPLLGYTLVGVLLLEAVHLASPAHAMVLPWRDRLMGVQFRMLAAAIIFAALWPLFLFWTWTAVLEVGLAGAFLGLVYYGATLNLGLHRHLGLSPVSALIDFILGVSLCTSLYRGVQYLAPVRGAIIIFGWLSLLGGAILAGVGLFFLGFLMIVSGSAIGERSWFIPGEKALLIWSRTAFAILVVQPAILTAWFIWGSQITGAGWAAFVAVAVITQLVAVAVSLAVEPPSRRLATALTA
jgi:hypothetical protein